MSVVPGVAVRETRPAVPTSVPELRGAVVRAARDAGLRPEALGRLQLAVSEAVSNAVVHAYAGRPEPGPVHVCATVEGNRFVVTVTDEGTGMAPRVDSPGLGLGVPLIAQAAEAFDVHLVATGGTELRMSFGLTT